jgi:type II secretory ATPase GspE/PulE/Tfp pilus assembly ATPase PilB-like protein
LQNLVAKRILEAQDVAALVPVRGKLSLIPENLARQFQVVPFDGDGANVCLLTTNTFSEQLKTIYDGFSKAGYTSDIYYTDEAGINIALSRYTQASSQEQATQAQMKAQQEATGKNAIAQIMEVYPKRVSMDPGDFLMQLIKFAFQAGASDMHWQAQETHVLLRLRIDGVLKTICEFTHNEYAAYVQKIKFMGGMKMNIDYLPQDGRLSFEVDLANGVHKKIDVRINSMPWTNSESLVLRYLDATHSTSTFEEIGFRWRWYEQLQKALNKHEGMILVTGPTGSGKTTTLYTILHTLNDGSRKIITLEDPVEYMIEGIEQSQINYSKWYTFEEGLKAILRHDPDIILVWETRTAETAMTSLNAALTGHLVFSTLHTNSALDSLSRLMMMGVEAYLLAPALQLIVAQRLVRKICSHCVTKRAVTDQEDAYITKSLSTIQLVRPDLKIAYDKTIPHSPWCDQCNQTGYIGRVALLEVMEITSDIRDKIVWDLRNTAEIMQTMRNNWFLNLMEDGLIKMLAGKTTLEELRRVI